MKELNANIKLHDEQYATMKIKFSDDYSEELCARLAESIVHDFNLWKEMIDCLEYKRVKKSVGNEIRKRYRRKKKE